MVGVPERPWKRRSGVIQTPRQTRMAYFGLETVNDGGEDAPIGLRDARFLALLVIGLLVVGVVVGVGWTVLT